MLGLGGKLKNLKYFKVYLEKLCLGLQLTIQEYLLPKF